MVSLHLASTAILLLLFGAYVHSFASFKKLPDHKRKWLLNIAIKQGYIGLLQVLKWTDHIVADICLIFLSRV